LVSLLTTIRAVGFDEPFPAIIASSAEEGTTIA
jgi:hypothetical protein